MPKKPKESYLNLFYIYIYLYFIDFMITSCPYNSIRTNLPSGGLSLSHSIYIYISFSVFPSHFHYYFWDSVIIILLYVVIIKILINSIFYWDYYCVFIGLTVTNFLQMIFLRRIYEFFYRQSLGHTILKGKKNRVTGPRNKKTLYFPDHMQEAVCP